MASLVNAQSESLTSPVPALKQGGYVFVVRHDATDPSQTDVYPRTGDMTTQRQLSKPAAWIRVPWRVGAASPVPRRDRDAWPLR